jgi:hypothetical protein
VVGLRGLLREEGHHDLHLLRRTPSRLSQDTGVQDHEEGRHPMTETPTLTPEALERLKAAVDLANTSLIYSEYRVLTADLRSLIADYTALRERAAIPEKPDAALRAALEAVRNNAVVVSGLNPPMITSIMDAVNGPTYVIYGTTMSKVETALREAQARREAEGGE